MERVKASLRLLRHMIPLNAIRSLGVDCIEGAAKIVAPGRVEVNGRR